MRLDGSHFPAFFEAVHGVRPFPWQAALVERLAAGKPWPDVLDLPTGAGKTAALDAAIFHLALAADAPDRAAIRICFVVDRRIVVDDAFARAGRIAAALAGAVRAPADPVVREVAGRLAGLSPDGAPLVAARLRGGVPLEAPWALSPTQPTIVSSTVDQIGSRLLFRGYGVSARMAPVHAGLLGRDTLVLLDEAHLSESFRQTLEAAGTVGDAHVRVAVLSATPGRPPLRPLRLSEADVRDPVLSPRLAAEKPARLRTLRGKALAEAFAAEAREMMDRLAERRDTPTSVGVVVNRVALAREIFGMLAGEADGDAVLVIGRSREVDRARVVEALAPFRTGGNRAAPRPLFVVATQSLEVGVDLDLDGLVTQAAPLDSLRQRFGRLDRAGRGGAEGAVLATADDPKARANDPVYGDRIRLTWQLLETLAEDDRVDFGVAALARRLEQAGVDVADVCAPREDAPVLMPAYVDLWSQTAPVPAADPEVGLFLHGPRRGPADVSLVWRRDVLPDDLAEGGDVDLALLMELVPPRAAEAVSLPVWTVRRWLTGRAGDADLADLPMPSPEEAGTADGRRRAFRWAGREDPRTGIVAADDIRPGDLVVVPANHGGCDRFGWAPDDETPAPDVAEAAAWPFRTRRWAVRLRADGADPATGARLRAALATVEHELSGADAAALAALLPEDAEDAPTPGPRAAVERLTRARSTRGRLACEVHFPYGAGEDGPRGAVIVARHGLDDPDADAPARLAAPDASTETDAVGLRADARLDLDEHCTAVADWARRYARRLKLPATVADDVVLAARLHDLGKADRRFQVALSGGDPWNAPDGPPAAKSARAVPPDAFARAGLPAGWRHEALSVRLARAHPELADAHDPLLVLWLIGTHHGLGRPFFGFSDPDEGTPRQRIAPALGVADWTGAPVPGPQAPAFDLDGLDWPALFEELRRRYGTWGLAHLEAIVRLADHRASAGGDGP